MKNKNIFALIILIVTSIVSLFIVLSNRNSVEVANNKVEFIIEYSELESLAYNSDYLEQEWLQMLKDMGLQSVALGEQTLLSYITEYGITYESYKTLVNKGDNIFLNIQELDNYGENTLILYIEDEEKADFIYKALSFYEDLNFTIIKDLNTNYIVIDQDKNDVLKEDTGEIYNSIGQKIGISKQYYGTEVLNVPIGFDEYKIHLIEDLGLSTILRPINYLPDPKGAWSLYLAEIDKYGLSNKMFFPFGSEVIGYGESDDVIDEVYNFIVENNMTFGLVETIEQRDHYELTGYEKLLPELSEDVYVRVFNTWPFISNRFQYLDKYEGPEEIANSYYRAITERNIRGIYLRAFNSEKIRIVTEPSEYEKMFKMLEERLEEHGYSYGLATTYEDISISTTMKIILTIQIVGFLIYLLNYLLLTVKLKYNLILLGVTSILVGVAYYIAPNASTSLSGLLGAITFSTLATTVFIKECLINTKRNGIIKGILYTIFCGFIAMAGGFYVGSIMSSTRYFLEFEYFRGVKLSLVLPILIVSFFTLIFYAKEIYSKKGNDFFKELYETTRSFLDANIKVKYVIALSTIGIIGLLYLARGSNNSNVQPLDIELMMRNFLENNLLARPRTKEFLISFPLMVFATFFAGNKLFYENKSETGIYIKYCYILFFAIIASVGLSSITNTFSHIRTPIYISIYRTLYGLGIGVVVGLFYILGFKIFIIICKKLLGLLNRIKGDILDNN